MPRAFAWSDRARLFRWIAALALIAGYADLVIGGLSLAPVLLVAGYLVFVPIALLAR